MIRKSLFFFSSKFRPSAPLQFEEKSNLCLLYYYKPRLYTYPILYSRYLIPLAVNTKLILNNPFFLTVPAMLPLMFIIEVFLLRKLYSQKKLTRQVVTEIYLHKDGETITVIYENQLWRKLKEDPVEETFHIPSLINPEEREDVLPLKGDLFPRSLDYNEDKPRGWAWMKYYRTPRNYLVIPKNSNYMNEEVMIKAMEGVMIDTSKKNIEVIPGQLKAEYEDE